MTDLQTITRLQGMSANEDIRSLGAFMLALGLGMLWLHIRNIRNRKYSVSEWLEAMRKNGIGTRYEASGE